MPATSKAFRRLAAIAEHHPEEVSPKNRSVLHMSRQQLHDYAATPEKSLPEHVKKKARKDDGTLHGFDWRKQPGVK